MIKPRGKTNISSSNRFPVKATKKNNIFDLIGNNNRKTEEQQKHIWKCQLDPCGVHGCSRPSNWSGVSPRLVASLPPKGWFGGGEVFSYLPSRTMRSIPKNRSPQVKTNSGNQPGSRERIPLPRDASPVFALAKGRQLLAAVFSAACMSCNRFQASRQRMSWEPRMNKNQLMKIGGPVFLRGFRPPLAEPQLRLLNLGSTLPNYTTPDSEQAASYSHNISRYQSVSSNSVASVLHSESNKVPGLHGRPRV